jgi:hypothetical protein
LPMLRMSICREIRKHYTAWRFLAMMDCSNQSMTLFLLFYLNIISICCKAIYLVKWNFEYRLLGIFIK